MHVNKATLARAAGRHMVKADGVVIEVCQRILDLLHHVGLHGLIHQALRGAPHQVSPFPQNIQSNADGGQRVEPDPARQCHTGQTQHDTNRSPDVGHQVPGIGLQRNRSMHFCRTEHHPGQQAVERRTQHRQSQAPTQVLQGLRLEQPPRCGPDNAQSDAHNEHAFKAGREVLRLVMSIRVRFVGRALGDGDHHQRKDGAGQVHKRLHRV